MVNINTNDNLTNEATAELERFINREFDGIDSDILQRAAGDEDAYYEIEVITPQTLICNECNAEFDTGQIIDGEDGDTVNAEEGLACPACMKTAPVVCSECESTFDAADKVETGGDCPNCTANQSNDDWGIGELELDVSNCGTLETTDDPDYFPPAWIRMWKCSGFIANEIQEDPTVASDCGFVAYTFEDEVYVGIDGGGYCFYSAHWGPLYRRVLDQKLPNDPVECPVCLGGTVEFDDGCPCPSCVDGKVPFKTAQQKREAQRDAAMKFVRRIVDMNDDDELAMLPPEGSEELALAAWDVIEITK